MNIEAKEFSQYFTNSSCSNGCVKTADSSGFFVGAEVWLEGALGSLHCRVAFIDSATVIRVRAFKDPDDASGPIDLSSWTINTAYLDGTTQADGNYDASISAATRGKDGNLITIKLIGDSADGIKSSYDFSTASAGNFNTVIQATSKGVAGDGISIDLVGNSAPAAKAFHNFADIALGVFDTTIEAKAAGVVGNDYNIELTGVGGLGSGVSIAFNANRFTITYESGVSTVLDIENAIGAMVGPTALIQVKTPGTPGNMPIVSVSDFIGVHLDSGTDGDGVLISRIADDFIIHFQDGVSTILDVEDAIAALTGPDALIEVKQAGTGATVLVAATDDFTDVNLEGGSDGGGVTIDRTGTDFVIHYDDGASTVGDVNTAIGALAGGDALIVVSAAGTTGTVLNQSTDDFGPTNLTNGDTPRISQPAQLVTVNRKFTKKASVP